MLSSGNLVGKFVQVRTRAVRGRLAAHYARVLVTGTSKTGMTVTWRARAFVADKLVWRDYAESISWTAIQRLRPYTK